MNYSFKRTERLKSYTIIASLFKEGQSFGSFPLRLVYKTIEKTENASSIQFALSVPKKKFPRAHDRNLLRRRVREAYRLHKHDLYKYLEKHDELKQNTYAFMVLYVSNEILPYAEIEAGMKKMINKFKKENQTKNTEGVKKHDNEKNIK